MHDGRRTNFPHASEAVCVSCARCMAPIKTIDCCTGRALPSAHCRTASERRASEPKKASGNYWFALSAGCGKKEAQSLFWIFAHPTKRRNASPAPSALPRRQSSKTNADEEKKCKRRSRCARTAPPTTGALSLSNALFRC